MYLSLFSFILSSVYFIIPIEMCLWFESLAIEPVKPNQIAIANADKNNSESRDEAILRRKAIAQGYRLENAQIDPQDLDRETYLYRVLIKNPTTLEVENFCSPDRQGIAKAILLSGSWDETGKHIRDRRVTIACTSGVLAKCVRWGYKPWKQVRGVSLRDYHQACTRMARADYCGNGISHTKDGTLIDVYDRLGIQQPEINSGLMFEAAWSIDGALLLAHTRYPDTLSELQRECPERLKKIYSIKEQLLTYTQAKERLPAALIFNNSVDLRSSSKRKD